MDFDDLNEEEDDHRPSNSNSHQQNRILAKKAKHDYQILEQNDLQKEMDDLATECSSVLGIGPSYCKILLSQFKWDKEVLLERFYENGSENFLLHAGIHEFDENQKKPERKKKALCQICFAEAILLALHPGHGYCAECWRQYLHQTILNEGRINVKCPANQCAVAIDENFARARLASGDNCDKALEKFALIQLNSFVEGNPMVKWCPAPNCGRAIKVQLPEAKRIRCPCGNNFCYLCIQPWHAPIGCGLLKIWHKQCNDDSETYNWINAFTKDCPKCKTAIEKNGGCNHMTCRAVACKYEFCWVCMGDWKSHNGNYTCNRYSADAKDSAKKADESRTALKRYLHYYDRYRNHETSLKMENKLYEQIRTKTVQFQAANFSYVETLFLPDAVDALCECRRTLMFTYAFAFYLKQENSQTHIFEDNQQDLEVATEQLSEYLERDLNDDAKDLSELRQKIQDKTRYVESRRIKMLQHCVEGGDRDQWCYNRDDINPRDGTLHIH